MDNEVLVYLVGDEHAQKTNSWLMMTNDKVAAVEFATSLEVSQIKTIKVKETQDDSE